MKFLIFMWSNAMMMPPDIAHYLFEGIVPNIISIVLQHFISSGYFTSHEVVSIIDKFKYKSTDKVDKPFSSLHNDERLSFKPTTSETWCLLRASFLFDSLNLGMPSGKFCVWFKK